MMYVRKYERYIDKIIQIILGSLFVVSGFVKGIDPMGMSLKVEEYFNMFHFEVFSDWSMVFAIALCAVEIFMGLMLLVGIYKRVISALTLVFILTFTIITFYLFIDPSAKVQECGCFGDALYLTNTETFFKNILFVTLSVIYTWRQFKVRVPGSSSKKIIGVQIAILSCAVILSLFVPLYSFVYLPPFDFLPFNKGTNILENMNSSQESFDETKLVYKNKRSGEIVKFEMSDITWQDTTSWEYIDTETTTTNKQNLLSKFVVYNGDDEDITSFVFNNSDYTFIVIAQQIDNLTKSDFEKMDSLYRLFKSGTVHLYLFTSSDIGKSENILKNNKWGDINLCSVDQTVLKSMIRNEIGVIMLKDRVISGKWNLKQNSFYDLDHEKLPALLAKERTKIVIYVLILLTFITTFCLFVLLRRKLKKMDGKEVKQEKATD